MVGCRVSVAACPPLGQVADKPRVCVAARKFFELAMTLLFYRLYPADAPLTFLIMGLWNYPVIVTGKYSRTPSAARAMATASPGASARKVPSGVMSVTVLK